MGTQNRDTAAAILEAGRKEFMEYGYEKASLRRIAKEASVTTGAIYGYFAGKEALFAALTCVMTMIVKIPVPATGGYVNLGDCVVLLAGWVLGPMYGGAAAGLGSMLADLVSGYPLYAPGTFVIKACMAVCAWAVFRAAAGEKRGLAARIGGALAGEAVMVAGYFAYEGVVLGFGLGAAAAIPGNLIQGVFGLAVSVAAAEALSRSGAVKEL